MLPSMPLTASEGKRHPDRPSVALQNERSGEAEGHDRLGGNDYVAVACVRSSGWSYGDMMCAAEARKELKEE